MVPLARRSPRWLGLTRRWKKVSRASTGEWYAYSLVTHSLPWYTQTLPSPHHAPTHYSSLRVLPPPSPASPQLNYSCKMLMASLSKLDERHCPQPLTPDQLLDEWQEQHVPWMDTATPGTFPEFLTELLGGLVKVFQMLRAPTTNTGPSTNIVSILPPTSALTMSPRRRHLLSQSIFIFRHERSGRSCSSTSRTRSASEQGC